MSVNVFQRMYFALFAPSLSLMMGPIPVAVYYILLAYTSPSVAIIVATATFLLGMSGAVHKPPTPDDDDDKLTPA
jgi:hypothetical protein